MSDSEDTNKKLDDIKIKSLSEAELTLSEAESALLMSVVEGEKALRLFTKQHADKRNIAWKEANHYLDNGDDQEAEVWLNVYWKEERARSLLETALQELKVPDSLIPD